MAFDLTQNAIAAAQNIDLQPNLILKIEGISTCFGAVPIQEVIRYGQNDLEYGDAGLVYGGSIDIEDQSSYVSFKDGTSTEIRQTLQIDKGIADSTSNLNIAVIDKNNEISAIISPGNQLTDILGRRVKVYFGFQSTNFPEDYIVVFRGLVQSVDSGAGLITFNLSHPDQKKRSTIYTTASTQLNGALTAGATVANVDATTDFLEKIAGPDGSTIDPDFRTYIRIDDEIIEYQTKSGTQFQSMTRGALGTTATTHDDNADVESFIRIGGNGTATHGITLALKMMLSGENTFQFTDIPVTNFVRIDASTTVANSIFFDQVDVIREYNIQVGDFIETTGATNASNNVSPSTAIKVDGINLTEDGSYITVSGVNFVEENQSSALMKIRSQFDVWPQGLQMKPDEVDIEEHETIRNTYIPTFSYDFYITEEINGRDFLSEQIYNPMSAFNLPRKSQASMGIHVPPLPNQNIVPLDIDNILQPNKIKISRNLNKNLINTIVYKFDQNALEPDRFKTNVLSLNQTAIDQTTAGRKATVIEAKGMREIDSGTTLATAAASRRLKKYAFGAEHLSGIQLLFSDGYQIEVGDKVLLNFSSLQLTDIRTGTRAGESRIMEVVNKRLSFKGQVWLDLVDTNFDNDSRFGLIGPASKIKSATDGLNWVIEESFGSRFGINEFQKWNKFNGANIRVVSPDYTTRVGTAKLKTITGNSIQVETSLGFTPLPGDIMTYSKYSDQTNEDIKLIYVSLSDDENDFGDGGKYYGLF